VTVSAKVISAELAKLSDAKDAAFLQGYFKTGAGEYGEGDRFRGIRAPALRQLVRKHSDVTLDTCVDLLGSSFHEDRAAALLMMVSLYGKGDSKSRELVYKAYLKNTARINNWDLVDLSAPGIVGRHLVDKDRRPLYKLAKSKDRWERRIAALATFFYIKSRDFNDTLAIASILLGDEEDLIHKAVGWMLREVGKKDGATARAFLRKHYKAMPRTMLRYAIEKFPEKERQSFLKGTA
jgi:3-methyladenine DNA glycosylase AlkD